MLSHGIRILGVSYVKTYLSEVKLGLDLCLYGEHRLKDMHFPVPVSLFFVNLFALFGHRNIVLI